MAGGRLIKKLVHSGSVPNYTSPPGLLVRIHQWDRAHQARSAVTWFVLTMCPPLATWGVVGNNPPALTASFVATFFVRFSFRIFARRAYRAWMRAEILAACKGKSRHVYEIASRLKVPASDVRCEVETLAGLGVIESTPDQQLRSHV